MLKAPHNRVDTGGMSGTATQLDAFEENCLTVLECYSVRDAAAKTSQPEYSGWLDRILEVPGVERSALTSIHGFLIAQGLIKFEFTGRSVGLQYQLSTNGRESIARHRLITGDDLRPNDLHTESGVEEKQAA
jgi:hypothetical protein